MSFSEPENKLQKYMDAKGYSIAELSRLSTISDKSIRKMLNRERTARRTKVKIAVFFQVEALKIFPHDPEL